jgi:hypothetical protein
VSNWLEKITGIEMVGHSGPSGLFFGVTYIVSLLILFVLIKFLKKK